MFVEKILLNFSASYFIPNNRIKNVLDFLFLISHLIQDSRVESFDYRLSPKYITEKFSVLLICVRCRVMVITKIWECLFPLFPTCVDELWRSCYVCSI